MMVIKNRILVIAFSVVLFTFLNSCASIPKGAEAVKNFEMGRYLGTWYEIARFDFSFEKDLDNVSAQYSLNDDGSVKVLNSGYNYKKGKWKKAIGLAKFSDNMHIAELKVSFFGPFYSGYNVIALDENYRYALVAGKSLKYLWILSRTKDIPDGIKKSFLDSAQRIGYDTSKLIWVKHDRTDNPFLNEK
ncbi:lipocalin family protein [Sphingobacterium mizutaii]|uniref:lipocalin family protein n=1 Tax=Sphingobacterium mizutaii TaxID=1010 RepID=UPI0028AAE841|nr:lipocalin family protein [Sphingobacterium mizutaii]